MRRGKTKWWVFILAATPALLMGGFIFFEYRAFPVGPQTDLFIVMLGFVLAAIEEWRQVRRGAGTAIVKKRVSPYALSSLIFNVLLLGAIAGLLVGAGTPNPILWSVTGLLILITGLPWLWGRPPGFYPARQDATLERWWNGQEWSEITRPAPLAPLAAWAARADTLTKFVITLTFGLYTVPLLILLASHLRPIVGPIVGPKEVVHTFSFFTLVLMSASLALCVVLILLWRGERAISRAISAGILLIYGTALCGYGIKMIHEDLQIRGEKFDGLGAFLGMLAIVYSAPLLISGTLLLIQAGRRIIRRERSNLTLADGHRTGH